MLPAVFVDALGRTVLRTVEQIGRFTRFSGAVAIGVVTGVGSWARWSRLGPQLYFVGATSIPVLALVGGFIGAILAIEAYLQFAIIGQENRLGAVINISLVKQIGPVLAAVMLAGRVGCSLTAELGSMRVTEQIDAMRTMAADPLRVLVAPRVVACVLMIPALTVVSNLCGVYGGWLICTQFYTANSEQYWSFSAGFVSWFDVLNGLAKAVLFGGAIGLIACFKGMTCRPGAQGVGRATTEAFVASFLAIIAINLVLAKALNDLDLMRTGGVVETFAG